jgi:hypothetical protein
MRKAQDYLRPSADQARTPLRKLVVKSVSFRFRTNTSDLAAANAVRFWLGRAFVAAANILPSGDATDVDGHH